LGLESHRAIANAKLPEGTTAIASRDESSVTDDTVDASLTDRAYYAAILRRLVGLLYSWLERKALVICTPTYQK